MKESIVSDTLGPVALLALGLMAGCNTILGLDRPPPTVDEHGHVAPEGADGLGGSGAGGRSGVDGLGGSGGAGAPGIAGGAAHAEEPGDVAGPEDDVCAPIDLLDEFVPARTDEDDDWKDCVCTGERPNCHAIYELKVTSIAPDRWHADLVFRKNNDEKIPEELTYWLVAGPFSAVCTELDSYQDVILGPKRVESTRREVVLRNVPLWPDQAAFDAAPIGATRDIFVISDGRDAPANYGKRIWFQRKALRFRKYCR